MNYDALTNDYWTQQITRVQALRAKIAAEANWISDGRIIPEDEDLVIGSGRRLPMAVLFIDLCDFSGRPLETTAEQDRMLRALNLFISEMIRVCEDYGGVVEKNTGDGLMAYFADNEGTPPESGCKRAVAAALTMFYVTANLINPILRNSQVDEFAFRVGVDYGNVVIAQVGAAKRFGSLVAIGTTANVACKMLDVAAQNELVIGQHVYSRLPAQWQREYAGIKKENSGWILRQTGQPYSFYRYFGRWNAPS